MRLGERGHPEHTQLLHLGDRVVQFFFQTTRDTTTTTTNTNAVKRLFTDLLHDVYQQNDLELLTLLYQHIGHTRDIIHGKGERDLAYMMVHVWSQHDPDLAQFAFRAFVTFPSFGNPHPYGSWKDIKYFCTYCKDQGDERMVPFAIQLANDQLRMDADAPDDQPISLVAKWIPRENSQRHGWLFQRMALHYFAHFDPENHKARTKAYTDYRKLLSHLNRRLETVQVRQCNDPDWSGIQAKHVTSLTQVLQQSAFLRHDLALKPDAYTKRRRHDPLSLVRAAFRAKTDAERNWINRQWMTNRQWMKTTAPPNSHKMLILLDLSETMPQDAALAVALSLADESALGRHITLFGGAWVNLTDLSLTESLTKIQQEGQSVVSTNSDFHRAHDFLLDAMADAKLSSEEVEDLTLVIISDMQIDPDDTNRYAGFSLYHSIQAKYVLRGFTTPPSVVFWNMRPSAEGMPAVPSQDRRCWYLSGYQPNLIRHVSSQRFSHPQEANNPFQMWTRALHQPRYRVLRNYLQERMFKVACQNVEA